MYLRRVGCMHRLGQKMKICLAGLAQSGVALFAQGRESRAKRGRETAIWRPSSSKHPTRTTDRTEPPTSGSDISVENPATGGIAGSVPDLDAAAVAELAKRARAAQPAWEAFGFEGRARVLLRAQKWLMDNAERVARHDRL